MKTVVVSYGIEIRDSNDELVENFTMHDLMKLAIESQRKHAAHHGKPYEGLKDPRLAKDMQESLTYTLKAMYHEQRKRG